MKRDFKHNCFMPVNDMIKKLHGRYRAEIIRQSGKIEIIEFSNLIVNEGKNLLLNVNFGATAKIATWYMGLIDNSAFTAIDVTDTISSHAGWSEFTTYSESVRQTWGTGSATSQQITNASPAVFSITGTATLNGIFVCTNSTKGGTTGTLWSAASFGSTVSVASGDQIKMTYTLSA